MLHFIHWQTDYILYFFFKHSKRFFLKKIITVYQYILRSLWKFPMLSYRRPERKWKPTLFKWRFRNFTAKQLYWLHPATLTLCPYMKKLYKFDHTARKTTLENLTERLSICKKHFNKILFVEKSTAFAIFLLNILLL